MTDAPNKRHYVCVSCKKPFPSLLEIPTLCSRCADKYVAANEKCATCEKPMLHDGPCFTDYQESHYPADCPSPYEHRDEGPIHRGPGLVPAPPVGAAAALDACEEAKQRSNDKVDELSDKLDAALRERDEFLKDYHREFARVEQLCKEQIDLQLQLEACVELLASSVCGCIQDGCPHQAFLAANRKG